MPGTQILCTLDISGTFENERAELIGAIKTRLADSTTLTEVKFKPLRTSDETTKISFQATVAGGPDSGHVASIETLVEHALKPFRADNRPISAAIASLQFERLQD